MTIEVPANPNGLGIFSRIGWNDGATKTVGFTADFQYVNNPGYNSARVPVIAGRLQLEL